jgi:transposase
MVLVIKWVSLMKIRLKMASQQQKRQRVADLLLAKVKAKSISEMVGVSLKTVYNIKKAMTSEKGIKRKSGSGGSNKKRNPEFLDALKSKISEDPTTSMRKLAGEMSVDLQTVRTAVHQDLGLKSFVLTPKHLLTESTKARQLERAKNVKAYLRTHRKTVKVFSDEKIFTVDAKVNRRNDRFLAASTAEVKGIFRTKHPAQIMMFGAVASDGKKMAPYFFKAGERVGADRYYKVLRYHVLPWLKANYPEGNYVWTQDGAPCHTAKKVQQFCICNFADFWPADFWPPSSPDLNPLDFAIWPIYGAF